MSKFLKLILIQLYSTYKPDVHECSVNGSDEYFNIQSEVKRSIIMYISEQEQQSSN